MKKWIKRLFSLTPFKVSLIVTGAMLMLYISFRIAPDDVNYLNLMDKKWVDFIQKKRGVIDHTDQVAIVAIDSKSVDRYGRWPWPRNIFADLINTLNEHYEAKTITFDIVFSEPDNLPLEITQKYRETFKSIAFDNSPKTQSFLDYIDQAAEELDGDRQFAKALAAKDSVIFGYVFLGLNDSEHVDDASRQVHTERVQGSSISIIRGYQHMAQIPFPEGAYPELSIAKIANRKDRFGSFNVSQDPEDGVIRRVHTVWRYKDRYYPALALKSISHYMDSDIQLFADEQGLVSIRIGQKTIYPYPDGSILLNYKGPQRTFEHYSVADILDKTVPVDALRNKILLVGVTEVGILDIRVTPVEETYPGVEVHANLIDNLLTDSYFRQNWSNDIYSLILILSSGLLMGILIPRLKLGWSVGLVLAMLIGYSWFHQYAVNEWLTWPSYIYVFLTILLNAMSILQFMFFISDRDKRFIKGAFQQYLSPDVINQLLEDPNMLKLGGEEKRMTALFSDVKGFSSISEKLTPTELVALLNDYLSEMSDIIMRYGGTVDKFEGDAIIAFFGAPVSYEDHASRAALVCIEMQNRLAEMRLRWKEEGKFELYHRIGINTGAMVVGNMGSRNRFNYTMMGNSVNLAARLEGVNKMYGIELLMSEMTYKECADTVDAREIDLIRVMGIAAPVRIYEILCRKDDLDHERRNAFAIFHQGLEAYRSQDFQKSIELFEQVLAAQPDDGPSKVFIERCQHYLESPPPEDWDGVYIATSK